MTETDIIIIGAGACGLLAAKELAIAGKKVVLLEARDRIGGRIFTLNDSNFSAPVEAGAEFIHGNLQTTLALINEAGLSYHQMEGKLFQVINGKWRKSEKFIEHESLLTQKLKDLEQDVSIAEFLEKFFPDDKYADMKNSLLRYVEGYDAADTNKASALAFRDELENEDEEQFRIKGGYGKLIQWLADEFEKAGGLIHLSCIVKEVSWEVGHAKIITEDNKSFTTSKVIITVPLGVWQADANSKGAISYSPDLTEKVNAVAQMGYGPVIKILLQFKEAFWKDDSLETQTSCSLKTLGFLISDALIPTWWTQLPDEIPLLTGWLAGPKAEELRTTDNDTLLRQAIISLSYLFGTDENMIKEKLTASHITNWTAEPFTRGAYSYSTLFSKEAKKILLQPMANTLFFAGEALNEEIETGTVEAAFKSGKRVVKNVLGN